MWRPPSGVTRHRPPSFVGTAPANWRVAWGGNPLVTSADAMQILGRAPRFGRRVTPKAGPAMMRVALVETMSWYGRACPGARSSRVDEQSDRSPARHQSTDRSGPLRAHLCEASGQLTDRSGGKSDEHGSARQRRGDRRMNGDALAAVSEPWRVPPREPSLSPPPRLPDGTPAAGSRAAGQACRYGTRAAVLDSPTVPRRDCPGKPSGKGLSGECPVRRWQPG